ncbi:winged helix-turn-helix domain-containing protein [Burkholderia ubonensis]|uniref:winged helix-turn-helix domain-containing protein n=1 Tax=Burkholderia ubonensis TaxID=101571 RepID=UPI001E422471|nr:winged helix-turn-helix domain-containing protein [Burkholderia ubonensis]
MKFVCSLAFRNIFTHRSKLFHFVLMRSHPFNTTSSRASLCSPPVNPGSWRPNFAEIREHVAIAIADQIEEAIRSGLFRPGDKLPTQQSIADSLGFHLNTVHAGFREVARRGLIRGFARRGTFVIDHPTN